VAASLPGDSARQTGVVARNPSLRASDAERDEVAAALRESLSEGRITLEEFDERLGAAYSAKTYGELDPLVSDLPRRAGTGPPTLADVGTRLTGRWEARQRNKTRRSWSRYVSVIAVCWAIWGVTVITSTGHNLEAVWPLWVTLPWGAILVRRPYLRRHGC